MAIKNFIHPLDKRVLDTDEALTDEIIAEFNTNEAEEEAIEVEVAKVSVVEAITALKTLKLYQEQRDEPNDQDFMAYLAKGLRDLEVRRMNSQKQTTLQQWYN
jgi:CO dehydrogenase/acetyl-CoA synthase alpha subunit